MSYSKKNVANGVLGLNSNNKADLAQLPTIDEDNMASDSAVLVPTQQSVKAYVDTTTSSAKSYQGGYNAATNSPDLDSTPIAGIEAGDVYDVTAAGTFFTIEVEIGDTLIASQDTPTLESHWVITQANLTAASIKTQYESNSDTNEYSDAEQTKVGNISVTQAVDLDTIESDTATNNAKVTNATHTGEVTGDTALTIAADAVTYAKMQNVVADNVLLGNNSGAGGVVDELTAAEVRTILGVAPKMVALAKAINYTAVDRDFILVTTGASDKTITLPAVASSTDVVIEVKKVDSGVGDVIIDGNAAETIDGTATQVISSQYSSLTLHCDGSTWHIK